jgi:hypothetical protein
LPSTHGRKVSLPFRFVNGFQVTTPLWAHDRILRLQHQRQTIITSGLRGESCFPELIQAARGRGVVVLSYFTVFCLAAAAARSDNRRLPIKVRDDN